MTDAPAGGLDERTPISDVFNTSVGPAVVDGLQQGAMFAGEAFSWLTQKFNEMDPGAQQWGKAIMGFVGGMIGLNMFSRLTGFDGFGGTLLKFAGAAALAIYMSSDPAQAAALRGEQTAPIVDQPAADTSDRTPAYVAPTVSGFGGPS